MKSQWPSAVFEYGQFASLPVVTEEFTVRGWTRTGSKKRITVSWAKKLQVEGVSWVTLSDGRVSANFTTREIIQGGYVGQRKQATR